jgi:arylsulfatase A-like enzyme
MHHYGKWKPGGDGRPAMRGRSLDACVQKYNRAVRALDEGVGQLLDVLEETGQLDNTLVIYTSDQGFAWGQHGFAWKYAPYEANLRCPLLVRLPGRVAAGKVCRRPVGGVDIVPTLFAIAGVELPWQMHGHDLSPLLADPEAERPHPVMIEQTGRTYGSDTVTIPPGEKSRWSGVPWYVFLRDGRYKYIRTLEADEIEELYDLESDPEELVNLAYDETHRARLLEFRRRLVAELKRTGAPFVDGLPEVKTAEVAVR